MNIHARYRHPYRFATTILCLMMALAPLLGVSAAPRQPRYAAAAPVRGGTLRIAFTGVMDNFDPAWAFLEDSWYIINGGLFNGLYRFDRTGQPQLDLAAAPPTVSADRKTWTFTLRRGVRFSNGAEVTADDLAFSITRVLSPHLKPSPSPDQTTNAVFQGSQAYISGKANSVSGIRVLGRYTIRFVLNQPLAVFPDLLAESPNFVVPKALVQKEGDLAFASHPVGTGPFVLQSWQKATDSVVLVRNPYYFRTGKPYVDKVVVSYNMPSSLIALKVEKGELDGYGSDSEVAGADAKQARGDPTYQHYLVPGPLTWVYWLDNDVRVAPMTNPRLRQAVAMAINRTRLVQLQGGQAEPAYQLYVALDPQHDSALDQHPVYPYDPTKAAALVKASGYHGQPIVILYTTGGDVTVPEAIQQDLQQIGLTVNLRGVPSSSQQAIMASTQGHNLTVGSWSIDFPDAYDLYSGQLACGVNGTNGTSGAHYCDPTADSLVSQAQGLPFGAGRNALLRAAQLRLLRSAAYVPLYYFKSIDMVSPKVGGFYYQPIYGWVLEDYWVKR